MNNSKEKISYSTRMNFYPSGSFRVQAKDKSALHEQIEEDLRTRSCKASWSGFGFGLQVQLPELLQSEHRCWNPAEIKEWHLIWEKKFWLIVWKTGKLYAPRKKSQSVSIEDDSSRLSECVEERDDLVSSEQKLLWVRWVESVCWGQREEYFECRRESVNLQLPPETALVAGDAVQNSRDVLEMRTKLLAKQNVLSAEHLALVEVALECSAHQQSDGNYKWPVRTNKSMAITKLYFRILR